MLLVGVVWALGSAWVFPLDLSPAGSATPSVPPPLAPAAKERMKDSSWHPFPRPPRKYFDGTALGLSNDEDRVPQGSALRDLTDAPTLRQIPLVNKSDGPSGRYDWHPFKGWNYCHFREGDRNWYGWRTGGTFHWMLWWAGRFWWHDLYSQRWLYFDRGYWWWQGPHPNQFQVFLDDGHYHSCDTAGVLLDDLMRTGTEEVETGPVPKPGTSPTPGKKRSGRHAGHHRDGAMGGD